MFLDSLILDGASRSPQAVALIDGQRKLTYSELQIRIRQFADLLRQACEIRRHGRVVVWMEARQEFVVAVFGAAATGAIFVPVNPVLKAAQVAHLIDDCSATVLVTTAARWRLMADAGLGLASLGHLVLIDDDDGLGSVPAAIRLHRVGRMAGAQDDLPTLPVSPGGPVLDTDPAAIFYTSGSTGRPKGVVVSHRNLLTGARSVAHYLENRPDDCLLAVLPLSFDAGFSQLTTAFASGARVVLHNHLLARDVLRAMARHAVTGLTAIPPLFIPLAELDWPPQAVARLRYFASTGGRMPQITLQRLRARAPHARPFLMYGLTEAFRSTYLPPAQVDARPDSIGRAVPNAEILVLRDDGTACDADEPGELVHRGPLVALGYWNDAARTDQRFRPLPAGLALPGLCATERVVHSGDIVRRDAEGYLYFIGRRDEMIKTSGYRVSPSEVEEILYSTQRVGECAAYGVDHPVLGQVIHVTVSPAAGAESVDLAALLAECRQRMPGYMVPARVQVRAAPLPRNPNGKIDRRRLAQEEEESQQAEAQASEAARKAQPGAGDAQSV
jgi:acyl-CoA ligase (AMP-forming) (exosortase A-associated)